MKFITKMYLIIKTIKLFDILILLVFNLKSSIGGYDEQ